METNKAAITKHTALIGKVKTIVAHHEQLTKAKGELFNIYSILNLKTKEVRTHSAFLAELLNPDGTHLLGNVFLKAFIALLTKDVFEKHLDLESTRVIVEYFIGAINDKNKTGGRIDILLTDGNGRTISIENKIDADDQKHQVERYYNYNKSNNRVIYLSKHGDEPSKDSSGKLSAESDYYIISYQKEIIQWLETCQAIAYDQPILRESIKQYKILIQKITHTLGNQEDKELKKVVIINLEEASQIASKYHQVIRQIRNDFRKKVFEFLELELKEYSIKRPKEITKPYASIWFYDAISNAKKTWFAVESFSGLGNLGGVLYVGIFNQNGDFILDKHYDRLNKWWPHHQVLRYDAAAINLSDTSFLQKISELTVLEAVAKDVANQIIAFINEHKHLLEK